MRKEEKEENHCYHDILHTVLFVYLSVVIRYECDVKYQNKKIPVSLINFYVKYPDNHFVVPSTVKNKINTLN